MRRSKLAFLVISILIVLLATVHASSPEGSTSTMSDREKRGGLRGPVKSCTNESTFSGMTDREGNPTPEVHSEYTTEYDATGRVLADRHQNSDGSQWVTRYDYDASGKLLKTTSRNEGQAGTSTSYSYDQLGRLQNINADSGAARQIAFLYDQHGRKTKIATSSPSDYRPSTAQGGSPFESLDMAPNLPGGGTATTIYDEHDRATEVQVRDANGELVNRAVRTYDAEGHISEEKQIWDDPMGMFPAEAFDKILEQSGLSLDQLQQEIRPQLTKLMGGHPGPYSVSYSYDAEGRVTHTSRRIFNHEDEIETAYNQQGDMVSEITRRTRATGETDPTTAAAGLPSYSEVRYSYQYDQHENWIEKADSYRSSPNGPFQPSAVTKRKLTYY